jgi:pilus assembly protein CpaD
MKLSHKTILLAAAMSLSACGTVGSQNQGLESVHQPVVQRADYVLDLGLSGDGLASGEIQRLEDWFQSMRVGYGDRITVDNPDPYGGDTARRSVANLAAKRGLLITDTAPITAGEIAPGSIRIIVSRVSASVKGCPDWSALAQPNVEGKTASNYGCATNANLAAMIASPEDLIEGRASNGLSSVLQSTKAIKTYRDAPTTGAGGISKEGTKQ